MVYRHIKAGDHRPSWQFKQVNQETSTNPKSFQEKLGEITSKDKIECAKPPVGLGIRFVEPDKKQGS